MLLLARIDERAVPSVPPATRLDHAASRVIADLAPAALARDVTLELATDGAVTAAVDGALLEVLLRNLLDNAVRHGRGPGVVTVSCRAGPGSAVLEVADQGPGVTDDELARLGQRFYRASTAQGPGSGLGLSIVQRVAENCGGTVTYRRGAGDRGLVVSVRFAAGTPG